MLLLFRIQSYSVHKMNQTMSIRKDSMLHTTIREKSTSSHHFRKQTLRKSIVAILSLFILSAFLAACGTTATATQAAPSQQPTPTLVPTFVPTPTLAPTATPTPKPTPTSAPQQAPAIVPTTPLPVPTSPPPALTGAPAILDLRPLSMSIVGHLDCQSNGAYICFARVLSRPNAQSNLHWFAFTNVPGNITFSPSSGVLAP